MLLLIPLLPFARLPGERRLRPAAVEAGVGRRSPARRCSRRSPSRCVAVSAAASALPPEARVDRAARSSPGSPPATFSAGFTLRLDPLSAVMILVVTGIGSLIHIYSTAYMHEERDSEFARYFSYLNLFAAFMLVLVLGANFLVMFVGWEGVGLCSYLLIGFWYQKKSAVRRRQEGVHRQPHRRLRVHPRRAADLRAVRHARLPGGGAQRSPRSRPRRRSARLAHHAAAVRRRDRQVGADSALRLAARRDGRPDAGVRADPRRDDGDGRRVHDRAQRRAVQPRAGDADDRRGRSARRRRSWPARSGWCRTTSSACSRTRPCRSSATCSWRWASARTRAGIFHLYTHAFFKALLFLGSGAVIHALAGEQDLRRMGGLKTRAADHVLDVPDRRAGDRRRARARRLLQQGRDPVPHVRRAATRCCGSSAC